MLNIPDAVIEKVRNQYSAKKDLIYKIYLFLVSISLSFLVFNSLNGLTLVQDLVSPKKAYLIIQCLAPACIIVLFKKSRLKFALSLIYLAFTYALYKFSPYSVPLYFGIAVISIAISQCEASFIIKITAFALFIALITYFTLYLLQLIDNEFFALRNGKLRNTLGFAHPNGLGSMLLSFALCFWCCFKNRFSSMFSIVLLSFFAYVLYSFVDSRTSAYVCVLAAVLVTLYFIASCIRNRAAYNLIIKTAFIICICAFTAFAFGFLFLAYKFDPSVEFYRNLDELLSTRLSLTHNGLTNFGISLFGQILQMSDSNPLSFGSVEAVRYQYLDALYIMIPVTQGVLTLVLLDILYITVVYKAFKAGYHRIGITLFLFSVYSLSESFFVIIAFNIYIYLALCRFENCDTEAKFKNRMN